MVLNPMFVQANARTQLQRLFDYWASKRGHGRLPGRTDIDPIDLPDLLPNFMLFEVLDQRSEFRIRLAGTKVEEIFGGGMKGKTLSSIAQRDRNAEVWQSFDRVIATGEPEFRADSLHNVDKGYVLFERLLCPLAADGATVDHVLGLYFYFYERDGRMVPV